MRRLTMRLGTVTKCLCLSLVSIAMSCATASAHSLTIQELYAGSGELAKRGDEVEIAYRITLKDGKEVDSTEGNKPARITLGDPSNVPGLGEGITGMRVGGRRQLTIVCTAAEVGNSGFPDNVPMIWEVELIAVNPPKEDHSLDNIPYSFKLEDTNSPGSSWRHVSSKIWMEKYPDGKDVGFTVVRREIIDHTQGTILRRSDKVEVFVPDMHQESTWVKVRNGPDAAWANLRHMVDAQSAPVVTHQEGTGGTPMAVQHHSQNPNRDCIDNLKQLALGIAQFIQDHHLRYQLRSQAYKADLLPYIRNEELFYCPLDQRPGAEYSFNRYLLGASEEQAYKPGTMVMLYEGKNETPVFRHDGRTDIAFADGHVRSMTRDAYQQGLRQHLIRWHVKTVSQVRLEKAAEKKEGDKLQHDYDKKVTALRLARQQREQARVLADRNAVKTHFPYHGMWTCPNGSSLEIRADGQCIYKNIRGVLNGRWSVVGQQLTLQYTEVAPNIRHDEYLRVGYSSGPRNEWSTSDGPARRYGNRIILHTTTFVPHNKGAKMLAQFKLTTIAPDLVYPAHPKLGDYPQVGKGIVKSSSSEPPLIFDRQWSD